MLTLFASLLGFISSTLPKFFDVIQDKHDRQHELKILALQLRQMQRNHSQRMAEIAVQADIHESLALHKHDASLSNAGWVGQLRASVRPVITYLFFTLFASVKACTLYILITDHNIHLYQALPQIWDADTQALFAAVISFWFGQRALSKFRQSH